MSKTLHSSKKMSVSFLSTPSFLRIPSLGIDISDHSVKYMGLSQKGEDVRPKVWGKLSIPDGIMKRGRILDRAQLVEILKNIKKETKAQFIHASLPEEHAYLFQTEASEMASQKEIETAIEFNLRENVPLAPEQVVFGYRPVSHNEKMHHVGESEEEENAEQKTKVISVSVYPREIVEEYLIAFKEAGFQPLSFEVEAQSIARAVVAKGNDETHMLLDIGTSKVGLSIINHGTIVFTSTLDVGGDDFTNAIKKSFANVTDEEVDKMKNERGLVRSKENETLFQALFSAASVLKDEVGKHCAFWNEEQEEREDLHPIERIVLCGGNANMKGLPEYLESTLHVPVGIANVWENTFTFDEYVPNIKKNQSLEYATSIGLALRSTTR